MKSKYQNIFLYTLPVVIFSLLLIRSAGIFPVVADEYVYSLYARQLPLAISKIPNFLYLWIYSSTNTCGDSYLFCGKLLNALFFSLSAPFIYLTARKYCGEYISLFIAGLAILAPVNSYTAYFMPESLYFFTFWMMIWYLLGIDFSLNLRKILVLGFILGIMSLVKPHALFLIPAIFMYFAILKNKEVNYYKLILSYLLIIIGLGLVKLVFGYLMAGDNGITIFGNTYGAILSSSLTPTSKADLLKNGLINVFGHIEAMVLIFSLPLCLMIYRSIKIIFYKAYDHTYNIDLLGLLLLGGMIIITAIYTALNDNYLRIHIRYYDFIFPLIYISIAKNYYHYKIKNNYIILIISFGLIIIGVYAFFSRMLPYIPDFVDAPDLSGLLNSKHSNFIQLFGIILLFSWIFLKKITTKIFIFIYLPLVILIPSYTVNNILMDYKVPSDYTKAALLLKYSIEPNELFNTVLVGPEAGQLYLENLLLKNRGATMQPFPIGNYDIKDVPLGAKWIMMVGDYTFSPDHFILENTQISRYKLLKVR